MRPEKLLPQESDGAPSSNSSCSSGNNIKGGGNGSEMVISIPLDSVVMPNHQIRHHQQNGGADEVINSQNNFLATPNQVTAVTSTIPSPKYVFIRQTSDGSFTTSGSSYITGNNGETAGVGDIILVESMEVSNTEPSFVVNANCTDEDLTSLTWLHDKDLLKSIVQCSTSDKSAYTSPIQVTNDGGGGGGEGDGGGGGGGVGHDCGNSSDRISPSDFLDESFISEDNSDQHSPKIVEISSANTNNRVVITTDSSNGIENGNNNNNDNNNMNQAKPTITNDVTYISVNSNNKIKNVGYSEQDNKILKNGISNNSSSSNSNIIKINDNNNNNINNDDESIDCSNINENDNRSSIINKRNVINSLVDKKSNIIPNTIRISSLTYSTKSGNERILGAIGVNNNSNNNNKRSENQSNAVIAVEHQYGGEQFVYDTNVDNNNIGLMNYEKNDTIPIVANNQEVSVISETCTIISSVPSQQQQQQQQQQRKIKTLQKLSTNNDNDNNNNNNTSVQSNTIQTTTATATTATISSTSLPSPLPPPPAASSSSSSSSSPSSSSSSPSQALSAFQHFHKKYLREMKSGEQKGCALNGTSRSHLNNNQNNNNDNNENSNNSTCFYYSDNYSNDSYNNANNTCNNNNNNNNNPITNNDNNNNVNYVYVNNTNNNNNNNNNSVNNQADSNNIQNVYVNNDNNNNVSCRNRNNNNNETTNGSISSLSYAQQRFYNEQSAPPPSNNQASSNNRLSVTKDNSQQFETMPTTSPPKNSPIIGYNSTSSTISNHPTPRPAGCPRQKHPNNLPYDPMVHTTNKPPYSFSLLIFMAIEDSPDKALPVKEIYSWIVQHFPYFKNAPNGWKNSVRHNLSLNKSFQKVEKAPNMGKGSLWRVEEQQRPNLLQALTRSPFFPNSAVDKTFSYKSTQLSRQDDNNSNHLHITPQKSNLDARLFPKLSKMINDIVTKGTYPESIDPDIEQDVGVEQSTILCRTNSNYNNKSDINDMNNIIGDIYHHHHHNNNKSNINLNNDIISNNEHNQIDKINNYSNSNDNIYKCSYNDNLIINNRNNNCNGDYCSSPNSAIDKNNITPYNNIQQRLARDCGADTMDDVNAATAMLALKHGPKIFTERFQNGSPVITSSPSEDHTYSAGGGNTSTGSHSQNGSDINSNGASSDAAYESSEESHVYAVSAEELEERRRHAEGVDALLSFAMSTSSSQSSSSTNKRYAPSDDDYNDQMTTIIKMNNGTTTTTTTIDYYQHSSNSASPSPSPAKKLKSSHNLRTKLKRKVQWVR